jgi:serine phosphatase RsbU (regulator of sigma subunit)
LIKEYLPDFFAFYKPRDIVSGDFYWFNVKEDKLFIATIDCTGHGVSGALMSINAYYLLNLAVNSQNMNGSNLKASEILRRLDEGISKELNQEKFNFSGGMDIALCVIDKDKKKMQFAGANNPLYILRSDKLIEVRGDKYAIGGESFGKEKKFTTHEIDLVKGDMIYLFSDGFADQFGGDNGNEKFKYNKFRNLLSRISKQAPHQQYIQLEENLFEWKKDCEQTDDILVVGFRV